MNRTRLKVAVAAAVVVAAGTTSLVAYAGHGPSALEVARASTAPYQQLHVAIHSGYGLFPDAAGITCIDMPGMGAMGIHYANGQLFADPAIDAGHPEALVYQPTANGRLKLVALEYVVLQSAWDATHSSPPELFGQPFNFTAAGNRFGLPAYYSLHAWIWKHNPAGTFEMWNPDVSCPA